MPPHDVKDLHYGDVLFYFYQDDYFDSITRLLAAQQLERLPHTEGEAELLLGGLYLSLGEHVEAGKIFEALLAGKASEAVRNKAWFYLGKVWYQRGYLEESERALRQVSDKIQPRISAERYMLLAQLKLRQGRYDEAIAALESWKGAPDWTAYAQFNLGVALVRKGRLPEAISISTEWARWRPRRGAPQPAGQGESRAWICLSAGAASRGRATHPRAGAARGAVLEHGALGRRLGGFLAGPVQARPGAVARAAQAQPPRRRRPGVLSHGSVCVQPAGRPGQAAEYYSSAIDSFDAEFKRIDESIEEIRDGNLLERLLKEDKKDTLTWYWQLKTLPDAPESRYLYTLLASNEFQEGLKNYRELIFMSRNIDDWREDVAAFDNMLDTRQHAYNEELPKADAAMAATDLDALTQKRVDFESRINAIEKSNDVAALGTPEEQRTWARLKRIDDFVQMHPDDPDLAEMRDKVRLMKGVMYWRLSESFKARLWNERRSVKELEASLIETQKRAVQVKQARAGVPTNTGEFADRVNATRGRMDDLQRRLADLTDKQAHYLQDLGHRGAPAPEAAHRDLPGAGALRAGGDLRQDHEQAGE